MSVTHVAQSTADGLWRPVLQKPADSEFFRSLLVLLCYKISTFPAKISSDCSRSAYTLSA